MAFAREHNEVRHYKVNRISAVDIQAQQIPIQRPADFDLKRHLTDSFGIMRGAGVTRRVRLRFTREVARIVREKTWHPSEKLVAAELRGSDFEARWKNDGRVNERTKESQRFIPLGFVGRRSVNQLVRSMSGSDWIGIDLVRMLPRTSCISELTPRRINMAKKKAAIRGIEGNLGSEHASKREAAIKMNLKGVGYGS